jgi:hypothetical protein
MGDFTLAREQFAGQKLGVDTTDAVTPSQITVHWDAVIPLSRIPGAARVIGN